MKRFNHISSKLSSSNIAIVAIPLLMIIPNVCLCITEEMNPWAICANLLIPAGIYTLVMSAFRRTYIGAILLIPFMALCAFQIVLLFLYHGSIIAVDMFMNVATTNSNEASELLKSLTTAMSTVLILYLPILIWCVYRLFWPQQATPEWLRAGRTGGLITMCLGLITLGCAYATAPAYRVSRQLFPVNVSSNMITAIERMNRIAHYHDTASEFTHNASSTHPMTQKEIYVMVIGETSRAGNFGLFGYERNTTPNLQKIKNLIACPKALSESNTTHKSVPMLLASLTAENFDSIYFRKSTITAFKEAG
ncbi:MAG: phosphoethanolamine transferase domain-containing protein, partial [Muribaculaceae bacterium]|nr:phosphoethanolamine transferase domain-containing protein [Muribaculaceae bacterium]